MLSRATSPTQIGAGPVDMGYSDCVPIPLLDEARAAGLPYTGLIERISRELALFYTDIPLWWTLALSLPELEDQPWPITRIRLPQGHAELADRIGVIIAAQLNLLRAGADPTTLNHLTCTEVLAEFSSEEPIVETTRLAYGTNLLRADGLATFVGDLFDPDDEDEIDSRSSSMKAAIMAIGEGTGLRIQVRCTCRPDVTSKEPWLAVAGHLYGEWLIEVMVSGVPYDDNREQTVARLTAEIAEAVHARNAFAGWSNQCLSWKRTPPEPSLHATVEIRFA